MSAGAIGGIGSTPISGSDGGSFSQLSTQDFLKVLFSELRNQDPLQPQDSAKLLEQLSSIRNIESQLSLQQKLESLVLQNQVSVAGGLIGKQVVGLDETNRSVQGLVTSVRVEDGKAMLELDNGKTLPMTRLTRIAQASS